MKQQESIAYWLLTRINAANFVLIRHPRPVHQDEKQRAKLPVKG